jgi:PadR family transcriptional regulator, regulatory protein AphA
MKIELTVLGLLSESNLYGYEIKKKIDYQVGSYVDIKFGSIYYIIKKGLKNGWIVKKENKKESGTPERTIYELLPEGRQRYKSMLKKYFDKPRLHFDIDFVLMFYYSLSNEQKEHFIEDRTSLVEEKLLSIRKKIKNNTHASPKNPKTHLYEYLENHLKAEQAWLRSLKK